MRATLGDLHAYAVANEFHYSYKIYPGQYNRAHLEMDAFRKPKQTSIPGYILSHITISSNKKQYGKLAEVKHIERDKNLGKLD